MNCVRLRQVLDAHIDGELDSATTGEIAAHLADCSACAALREQRRVLQQQMRKHAPYFSAPASLAPAVRQALAKAAMPAARRVRPTWWQAAAFASVTALSGLVAGYWLARPLPDNPLREPATVSHIAALAPKRQLTDVTSSDRHTVKPWFQGKLDFAPPVKDLTAEGYVLLGGRLDQVADRQAAAVVYRVRNHVINLFIWRATEREADAITASTVRGFSVVTWAEGGLRFAAVSDVDGQDLGRFARLVSARP